MYKTSGRYSQRQTRTEATIVLSDRAPIKKGVKECKPLPRLLRGKEKANLATILNRLKLQPDLFSDYGGPEALFRCYKIIKTLDDKRIRHWRAVSQYLERAGFREPDGTALKSEELQRIIRLINKTFRTKRRSRQGRNARQRLLASRRGDNAKGAKQ